MSSELKDKVAIITGAARGLGDLVATDLAREGMHVVGTDIREDELSETMTRIEKETSRKVLAIPADLGDEKQVVDMVRLTLEKLGRIDLLVNNAGIRQIAPVWGTGTEMWDRIHNANLKAQFL